MGKNAEIERAGKAKRIIEDPLFCEAWDGIYDRLREHMEAPESTDEQVLEARRGMLVLRHFRRVFEQAMETGYLAEMERSR